jgi:4-hydroxybenzoate polyprenyltransferase
VWTKYGHLHELAAAARRYVWSARVGDFAVLATIPLLGFAYGTERVTPAIVFAGAALAAASLLLVVHIFALNDWADYHDDRKAGASGKLAPASRNSILLVSVISLAGCIGVVWSMSRPALLPALGVVIASAIYSLEWPIRGKEVLLLSSALHAICGAGCFLLGLAVAAGLSLRGSEAWTFIGLSMAAGHIHQEISDYREDLASRARTHATELGPRAAFTLGQLTFAAAFLALLILAGGTEAGLFRALVALAWAVNLALAIACWRDGLTHDATDRYRSRYRVLYSLIGLALLLRTPALAHLADL